jgi:hypothetical protein
MTDQQPTVHDMVMLAMPAMQSILTLDATQTAREMLVLLQGESVAGPRLARVRALAATLAFPAPAPDTAPPRGEKRSMVTPDPWREPPAQRPSAQPVEKISIFEEGEACQEADCIWQDNPTVANAQRVWDVWAVLLDKVTDAGGVQALPRRQQKAHRLHRTNRRRMEACCQKCFGGDLEAFLGQLDEFTIPPNKYSCRHAAY